VREFGNHNIRELITDGDNVCIRLGFFQAPLFLEYSESSVMEGHPRCFNDVDLEGKMVSI
jgi:hypothetical protein